MKSNNGIDNKANGEEENPTKERTPEEKAIRAMELLIMEA